MVTPVVKILKGLYHGKKIKLFYVTNIHIYLALNYIIEYIGNIIDFEVS